MSDIPDIEDICDEVWHGTNGDDLLFACGGCPGCHYVAGGAVALGIVGMATAIRERVAQARYDALIAFVAVDDESNDGRSLDHG